MFVCVRVHEVWHRAMVLSNYWSHFATVYLCFTFVLRLQYICSLAERLLIARWRHSINILIVSTFFNYIPCNVLIYVCISVWFSISSSSSPSLSSSLLAVSCETSKDSLCTCVRVCVCVYMCAPCVDFSTSIENFLLSQQITKRYH